MLIATQAHNKNSPDTHFTSQREQAKHNGAGSSEWKKHTNATNRVSDSDTSNMGIGIKLINKSAELLKISQKSRL